MALPRGEGCQDCASNAQAGKPLQANTAWREAVKLLDGKVLRAGTAEHPLVVTIDADTLRQRLNGMRGEVTILHDGALLTVLPCGLTQERQELDNRVPNPLADGVRPELDPDYQAVRSAPRSGVEPEVTP
jgi:hypothetical protein